MSDDPEDRAPTVSALFVALIMASAVGEPSGGEAQTELGTVLHHLAARHRHRFGTAAVDGPSQAAPPKGTRCAAVLVGLFTVADRVHVLLTQRSGQLRAHAGEVALPVRCAGWVVCSCGRVCAARFAAHTPLVALQQTNSMYLR